MGIGYGRYFCRTYNKIDLLVFRILVFISRLVISYAYFCTFFVTFIDGFRFLIRCITQSIVIDARCYDHEFAIAQTAVCDHGCVRIR